MFRWIEVIREWLFGPKEEEEQDEIMQLVLNRCIETGNMVHAKVTDEGEVIIEEFPMPKDT